MSKDFLYFIFNAITIFFIAFWIVKIFKEYNQAENKKSFFTYERFGYVIALSYSILLPFLLLNLTPIIEWLGLKINAKNESLNLFVSIILSFITALIWLDYILKLDVYEREKKRYVIIIFILGAASAFLTFPLYNLASSLGFSLNGKPLNDLLYCVFGIGLIEETVKFLPIIFILWKGKVINEPYDFILYASVSALGFAFAENVLYLKNRGIEIILARTFYATVAHMTFSSTIAYGIVLYKQLKPHIFYPVFVGIFFLIAISSHGFYNFWLLNPIVSKFSGFTTLFFLITVHIWFTMKNNLINLSNFYSEETQINNDDIQFQLVRNLIGVVGFLYIYVGLTENVFYANQLLYKSYYIYGYITIYLAVNLSKYHVVKGYLKPFQVPFDIFIPKLKETKNPPQ
ncbi:MAG: PrsW family intramembrane metalloprotease [Bacteroidia bacterium]